MSQVVTGIELVPPGGSGTTIVKVLGVSVAVGDALVVIGGHGTESVTYSCADDLGGGTPNAYANKATANDANSHLVGFYCPITQAGSPTITITCSGSVTNRTMFIFKIVGATPFYETKASNAQATPTTGVDATTTTNGATLTHRGAAYCGISASTTGGTQPAASLIGNTVDLGAFWFFSNTIMRAEYKLVFDPSANALTFTAAADVAHLSMMLVVSENVPFLSAQTPSGRLATSTTATVGCTTDSVAGTLYVVVDTPANLNGVTATQIKNGQNKTGAAADESGNSAVSGANPSVAISNLTAGVRYAYSMVQNDGTNDSNIVGGTFTTDYPVSLAWDKAA